MFVDNLPVLEYFTRIPDARYRCRMSNLLTRISSFEFRIFFYEHSLLRRQSRYPPRYVKDETVDYQDTKHARIQIVTIEELIDGKKLDLPALATMPSQDVTFKKALKARSK